MIKTVFLSIMCIAATTSAIVVQDYSTAEVPPPDLDWSYVYNYKNSSAVAVGANWLLTAAHVADDGGSGSVSADGTTYTQQEIVFNPSADLALVRYDKTFPGFYSLFTGNVLADTDAIAILVGYGTIGSARDFGWTDNGSGRGTKRWGTQKIDRVENNGFWMDFDLANTTYEAGTGVGDSGGGVFYDDDGVWKLAGINTQRAQIGGEYKQTFAIGTSDYAEWIVATIPEPGTTSLMGLATFGLFLMRAGTRKKSGSCSNVFPSRKVYACDQLISDPVIQQPRFRMNEHLVELVRASKGLVYPVREWVGFRHKKYDRLFWNHMVTVHERHSVRRTAFKLALKQRALSLLDVCLERIMK